MSKAEDPRSLGRVEPFGSRREHDGDLVRWGFKRYKGVMHLEETPRSALIVETLARSVEEVTGTRPRVEGAGPACDGWMLSARDIESICGYGVECGGVHGAEEWVGLVSLQSVTEIYAHTILGYLGLDS